MTVWVIPSFLSATAALFLAGILFVKRKEDHGFLPLILVMATVAWIHGLNGVSHLFHEHHIIWKKLILLGELTLPVMIGYVSLSLVQNFSSNPEALGRTWWWIIFSGAVVLGMLIMADPHGFMKMTSNGDVAFNAPDGLAIWSFIVLAWAVGVRRLEQILRSFRDPLRYRLKYILIGMGGLSCISLAQAVQMLWIPVWSQNFIWAGEIATLSSILLMGVGVRRWQIQPFNQKVQMSHHALYTSLTVLCAGGYIVVVGIVAAVIQRTGWEFRESLGVVVVFFALLGLVLTMLSRRARAAFQYFIARHFFRTKYDYREKWLEITEAFIACKTFQQIWDRYLEYLSQTFGASRVTIWKHLSVDGRYHQIRKDRRRKKWAGPDSAVTPQDPLPVPAAHPVIVQMKMAHGPVLLTEDQSAREDWKGFLQLTQAHVCVPLLTGEGRLLGFCTLSKKLHEKNYDQEDCDLLRAIAHHVTMILSQFELVEERSSAAKWEAVHRFSAFYLHDLKNLASSLSMVAQNSEEYGSNPEFQASAMRTVRNTSQRIIKLMEELASQAKKPDLHEGVVTQLVDMNLLIQETLAAVEGPGCRPNFHPGHEVPRLDLKPEAIKQVLLNLILNARHATGEKGTIDISTAYDEDHVIIEIVDTGGGMSADQLENLFQPFKSSKKNGLGVGLFQCKRIVEDHHGMIHIESQKGQGTTVIITFPVKNADNSETVVSGITKTGVRNGPRNTDNHEI